MKLFFFKVLFFGQIFHVYVACANLFCIIVEQTPKVLLFMKPQIFTDIKRTESQKMETVKLKYSQREESIAQRKNLSDY